MHPEEQVLATGGVTHVVRIGDTVRRPVRPFTATVQEYLRYLCNAGIGFVPEPHGYDGQGREILSFVEGEVPVEPLPSWATSDDALGDLAQLIRRLHDVSVAWEPPRDAIWGTIPGTPSTPVPPLFDVPELVSHQDYCPGNVVFRDRRPFGFIDFDLARPTTRVADCVNAAYWWAPLLHPFDRSPSLSDTHGVERLRLFADAYGMDSRQRALVVPLAVQRSKNSLITMRAAADADPVFNRWWKEGMEERLQRAERWLAAEAPRMAAALRS
ncbi:aminoglycoside phosphotransferase family protein [Arthrobacter sp. OAP107]|uniref:phosphotransferase enzyme family protein n=1 Tax=Arthrobacter sp. OAP107 TaxID=3156445 RepID=UPI0033942DE2